MLLSTLTLAALSVLPALAVPVSSDSQDDFSQFAGAPVNNITLTVTPDKLRQCDTANVTWTPGAGGPYEFKVGKGGYYVGIEWIYNASLPADAAEVPWTVQVDVNTSLIFQISDKANQYKYLQNFVVQPGSASCLTSSSASGTSSASATASTSVSNVRSSCPTVPPSSAASPSSAAPTSSPSPVEDAAFVEQAALTAQSDASA